MTAGESTGALTPPVSDRDHVLGSSNAKITLVEYGDYECPHCARADPIVKHLQHELGTTMRFVFRNFPLSEAHPHALHAAIVAETVGVHGEDQFWRMHDLLYRNQDALEDEDLVGYAKSLGVPGAEVIDAFAGGKLAERVRADFRSGIRSGVNGTPTFFVNGERYDGNWTDTQAFLAALRSASNSEH